MKRVRSIIYIILCVFCLVGCNANYTRDSSKGKIEEITFETLANKVENEKLYLVQISLENCEYCKYIKEIEKNYIQNHNITIYDYTLNSSDEDYEIKLDYIEKRFTEFKVAPSLFWIDKEKNKNLLTFEIDEEEKQLDKLVTKFEIDKK